MISVEYRRAPGDEALVVEWDERRLFWPFRAICNVRVGGQRVERAWRGATLRETVRKAAASGCLALEGVRVDAVCATLERELESRR